MENNSPNTPVVAEKNGLGVAGFVLSLVGLVLCWVPFANFILSGIGFILSLVGVFRRPKGLAIAGIIIAAITLVVASIMLIVAAEVASEAMYEMDSYYYY